MPNRVLPPDFSLMVELRAARPALISTETLRHLKMSTLKGKYEIFRDIDAEPCGYVAWADINVETLTRFLRTGLYPKYLYEWDEGHIRFILDAFIIRGATDPHTSIGLTTLVKGADFAIGVRRGALKVYTYQHGRIGRGALRDVLDAYLDVQREVAL
jgi:hypothetical protein